MTKKEIMKELDKIGREYNSRLSKRSLETELWLVRVRMAIVDGDFAEAERCRRECIIADLGGKR